MGAKKKGISVENLATELSKSANDIKVRLGELGITFTSIKSVIADENAQKVRDYFNPPRLKKKASKIIRKSDIEAAQIESAKSDTDGAAETRVTAVAVQMLAKQQQEQKAQEEKVLRQAEENAAALLSAAEHKEKSAKQSAPPAETGQPATAVQPETVPAKPNIHLKKERVFRSEKTFVDREANLHKLFNQKPKKNRSRYKKMKLQEKMQEIPPVDTAPPPTEITLVEKRLSLQDFALAAKRPLTEIMGALLKAGLLITINQKIDPDIAKKIGELIGVTVQTDFSETEDSKIKYELTMLESSEVEDKPEDLFLRPPIVTIMGHVDHGKTKLLDAIRSSRVVEGEVGGITQHIGAYQVEVKGKKITFLDTPGHEAFTALRARGAQVTDIVVLVVAANDGIKPQTVEAIAHAKAAGVPIIVAINKIDLPDADIQRVKQQLTEHELVPEDWGGKTVCCEISAKQKIGLDNLLEMILLVADMEALQANPSKKAQGIIIEAHLSKRRGPVATVLVKGGTLRKGDPYVIGTTYGRVRAMFDDLGQEVKEAGPSRPVEIIGITEVPRAGELFQVHASERDARVLAERRQAEQKDQLLASKRAMTLSSLSKALNTGDKKTLNVLLKGDVQGSLEAITASIGKIQHEKVSINIVHSGTGSISESDVMLAKASEAVILAFTVEADSPAALLAKNEEVEIRHYNIIYKLLEDLELALNGLLGPEYEEVQLGKAEVRNVFKSSKAGAIAGAFVTEGVLRKNADKVMLYRGNKQLVETTFASLKRFKDDVKEVALNYECGFTLEKFNEYAVGDVLVVFARREKARVS
ncbi:translation initiation factor IF-2 [Candidatus Termititenax persephonae]|uniref:Translation initiation factor IF-2 n=1 Tax=Candidatus Termititenax persephonae TaxID=2218525 RepID=A0A388TF17_9BACT|nr:translation initiation factor IF-2 [Candidatus Termititenax persephonae]